MEAQEEGSADWAFRDHLAAGESTIAGVRNRFSITPAGGTSLSQPLPLQFLIIRPTPEAHQKMWPLVGLDSGRRNLMLPGNSHRCSFYVLQQM